MKECSGKGRSLSSLEDSLHPSAAEYPARCNRFGLACTSDFYYFCTVIPPSDIGSCAGSVFEAIATGTDLRRKASDIGLSETESVESRNNSIPAKSIYRHAEAGNLHKHNLIAKQTTNCMKQSWKPGTLIYPLPAVLVSVGATPEEYNMLTVAWTGTVNSEPPMSYISVRPERHSYPIIERTGEFVINLTTEDMARATDWCGVRSGRDFDKWKECGLTPVAAEHVAAPVIAEAPLSIECRVRQIVKLGSHDMFIADVVGILADERYIDPTTGRFSLEAAKPLVYLHGEYFRLGEMIGHFGWSVRKKKTIRREKAAR